MKNYKPSCRILSFLLAVILSVTSVVLLSASAEEGIVYGDADGNDHVEARDLMLLRKFLSGFDYETGTSSVAVCIGADANGDDNITAQDLMLLRKYFAAYDYEKGTSSVVLGPKAPSDIPIDADLMNILIIGTDALTPNGLGRSDSMIIVTISPADKRIVLTSILRDLYVHIPYITSSTPDGMWNKINAAHSYGGTQLLERTIEENFGIHIDRYIKARYADFVRVYQILGGVDISLSQKEVEYINDGLKNDPSLQEIYAAFEKEGLKYQKTGELPMSIVGQKTTLGSDALFIYARARKVVYTSGEAACKGTEIVNSGDFGRSDRQRLILMRTIEKVKKMNLIEMIELLDACAGCITTDLSYDEFRYFISHAATLSQYTVAELRLPCTGTWDYGHVSGGTSILQVLEGGFQKMHDKWVARVKGVG